MTSPGNGVRERLDAFDEPLCLAARGVVVERRDRRFWLEGKVLRAVVPRDPYFVIEIDTGNS